ncbi:MAG: alpha-glucosidase [Bacteroidia bacterium]|nr:alpha-glucosidase [Bacteroidia bacterium]MBT8269135.1 alpha-glucosidase [Bacteroidia bacterium]
MKKAWWKEAVVYQIYPRSYMDSNGDGVGDIPGIISKLDYIKSLGVDIIWLCPVYESPNDDNGYDISDYRKISEEFGGDPAFDELLEKIHGKGLKLVMDLVVNHSSDEHEWFEESRKSKDSPYRDYYFWKPGKDNGPPNNWTSFFSGSTWEYDSRTDEYFLHLFTKKQPDLNWENPKVRQEIYDVVDYWFKRGIDGFRMDVISLISKQLEFEDASNPENYEETIKTRYANGPRIHEFLQEMNKEVLSKYDIMTVGEGPGIDLDNALFYVDDSRDELNMVFHFDHMFIDNGPGGKYDPIEMNFIRFKEVFSQWDERLKGKGWGSIFLGNHDFSRMVSRFGSDSEFRVESSKMLAMLLLSMRGTVYVYQGDEIGMTNVAFPQITDYNDVETLNSWKEAEERGEDMNAFMKLVHKQSRDNARTPMQWDSSQNAGFSSGTPWIKVNPNYEEINVADQEPDSDSILNFYRKMIAFRKNNPCLVYGDYQDLAPQHPSLFAFRRWDEDSESLVLLNFSSTELMADINVDFDKFEIAISNMDEGADPKLLLPWQGILLKRIN